MPYTQEPLDVRKFPVLHFVQEALPLMSVHVLQFVITEPAMNYDNSTNAQTRSMSFQRIDITLSHGGLDIWIKTLCLLPFSTMLL